MCPSICPPAMICYKETDRAQHWELHALLFVNSMWVLLHPTEL